MRTLSSTLPLLALLAALPVQAATPAEGPHRLVAGAGLLAVIRGPSVHVFDATGRPLLRLPSRRDRESPAIEGIAPTDGTAEVRERLWDWLGVPEEERDSDAASDLADDELLLSERRPAGEPPSPLDPARSSRPGLAAATADTLYVIAGGWLSAVTTKGVARAIGRAPARTRALAASAAGDLFVATDEAVLVAVDGGRRFHRLISTGPQLKELVAHPTGQALAWATSSEVVLLDRSGERRAFPVRGLRALRFCQGRPVALTDEGVLVLGPGPRSAGLSSTIDAERLACPDSGGGPWLGVGPGFLASSDGGRRFRPRRDAPTLGVADAVVLPDRVWLLVPEAGGLWPLPWQESPERSVPTPEPLSPGRSTPAAWMHLLPRVALSASRSERTGRREDQVLLLAELPLGAPTTLSASHGMLARQEPGAPSSVPAPAASWPAPPSAPEHALEAGCLAEARAAAAKLAAADPRAAASLVRRAGRSAWLPELRLRVEQRLGRSESLDVRSTAAAEALGLDTDNDVRYEVRATWDLPRLVFHPDEVAAAHQALRMADMRREIESQVNRLYFERRRLAAPLAVETMDAAERAIRFEELGADLDAHSGGAWSRCLGHAGAP